MKYKQSFYSEFSLLGLALIAIGTGGIKPCVSGGKITQKTSRLRLPREILYDILFTKLKRATTTDCFSIWWGPVQAARAREATADFLLGLLLRHQRRLPHLDHPHAPDQGGRGVLRRRHLLLLGLWHPGHSDGGGHRDHCGGQAALCDASAPGQHPHTSCWQYWGE